MSDLNSLTLNAALNEAVEWLTAAEYAQAVARCDDLLSSYPDAVRVLSVRARALQALGETVRAAQDYARTLEITPVDQQSLSGLMRCQLRLNQRREAVITARQLLDYDASHVDAVRLVREAVGDISAAGRVLRTRQRFAAGFVDQAIAEVRAMLNAAPDRTDLQVILAEMLWRAGLRVTTVELCQAILDAQPDCLNAHIILSDLWSQIGSTHMRAFHLKAAARLDPDFRETAAWLGDRSPVPVQDVPALIDLARHDAAASEDEAERSEWVDQLIASANSSTMPADVAWRAENYPDAEQEHEESSDTDKVIFPPLPLDWQPDTDGAVAQAEAAHSDTDGNQPLPGWLTNMREQSQPLSQSDWEAAVSADDKAISREAVRSTADFENVVSPLNTEATFAPLEWQPAELAEPAEAAVTASVAQSRPDNGEPSAPFAPKAATSADKRAAQPGARRKARQPKAKASTEDLLLLARRSVEAADYTQAAYYYSQLVTLGKKLDEVLFDLDAATHAYPDLPEFHVLLGRIYTRKGDLSAALAAYQRVLRLKS
ncbi:MAG: hypothetical protein ACUVR3_02490 [Candidatus Roseilinea sp.]|uniref:hypothetical protein n=1 Tax=Candidatus Roseilinea sp. TaxID=2838777 RepID=UPI0040496FB2